MRVRPKTTHHLWLILLLITIADFHTAKIRPGHIWGDDFAMYIHHTRNIVEGRPYAQTGYLFTPTAPISPRMYPPVFPWLLTYAETHSSNLELAYENPNFKLYRIVADAAPIASAKSR
jgi:hypothetical protein